MRRRFPVSVHLEFKDALGAKHTAQEAEPDKHYQIRKYANGFRLVERLETNEAKVIEGMRHGKSSRRRRTSVV